MRTREGLDGARFLVWPEPERATAYAVEGCESDHGRHPHTYDVDAENGGVMQIRKETWAGFFWETEGWSWEQIVRDDVLNHRAGYIIWQRAGGWAPWSCWS